MKTDHRLKKNKDFQTVFKRGTSKANRQFVVYYFHQKDSQTFRFGLSVSKKIGNAVTRNRIKRRLREMIRQLEDEIHVKGDFIIIVRKPITRMQFFEIKSSLIHVFKRIGVLKANRKGMGRK